MTEIERLRADLEVLKDYESKCYSLVAAVGSVEEQIARLEAEADPWREAKTILDAAKEYVGFTPTAKGFDIVVKFVDHLTAENERLMMRVAELEAAAIRVDLENGFYGVKPEKPELNRHRTIATACKILASDPTIPDGQRLAGALMQMTGAGGAKPYEVESEGQK